MAVAANPPWNVKAILRAETGSGNTSAMEAGEAGAVHAFSSSERRARREVPAAVAETLLSALTC